MEDKNFELLTRMYSEFSSRFDKIETDVQGLKKDVLRMEIEHGKKLDALFDGYLQHDRRLDVIEQKIDALTEIVERHDVRIQVIEGGRK